MTKLELWRLDLLKKEYGDLSSKEALEAAIHAEQVKLDCGIGDPEYQRYADTQRSFEWMALLLEKESAVANVNSTSPSKEAS